MAILFDPRADTHWIIGTSYLAQHNLETPHGILPSPSAPLMLLLAAPRVMEERII